MGKPAIVQVRVDAHLKARAEAILAVQGLTADQAIELYYRSIVFQRRRHMIRPRRDDQPRKCLDTAKLERFCRKFRSRFYGQNIPNATTRQAMRDVREKRGLTRYSDTQALFDRFRD